MRAFAWLLVGGTLAVALAYVALGQAFRIPLLAPLLAVGGATLALLRQGKGRAAALLVNWGAWAGILLGMSIYNGVQGPGITLLAVLLVLSAWVSGQRVALWLTLLTPPVLFALGLAAQLGWPMPQPVPAPPLYNALVLSVILTAAGLLGRYVALSLRDQVATLQRSRTQFESVLRSSPTPGAVLAAEEGRFLACNDAFLKLFGGTRDALIGGGAVELGVFQDPSALERARARLGADGRLNGYPLEGRNAAGEPRFVLVYAEPIEWQGRPAVLAQVVDVTALRQAEAKLRALNLSLEHVVQERTAELAAAKEELEGLALLTSHDVRAPLRWIHAHAEALAEGLAGPAHPDLSARVAKIESAAQQLDRLMDDLLEMQRVGQARFEARSTDLSGLAREILGELRRTDPSRSVDLAIEPALRADADPALARAILQNLLDNAWKFTARVAQARIEFGREPGASAPVYFVRDNGAGMDMSYAGKLFKPFQRLHSASEFEGTGVGLASVARAVRRHGGRVWAESAPQRGATFRFTLAPE